MCIRDRDRQTDTRRRHIPRLARRRAVKINLQMPRTLMKLQQTQQIHVGCEKIATSTNNRQITCYISKKVQDRYTVSIKAEEEVVCALANDKTVGELEWPRSTQISPNLGFMSFFVSMERLKLGISILAIRWKGCVYGHVVYYILANNESETRQSQRAVFAPQWATHDKYLLAFIT